MLKQIFYFLATVAFIGGVLAVYDPQYARDMAVVLLSRTGVKAFSILFVASALIVYVQSRSRK
jgi:hypothetical protein